MVEGLDGDVGRAAGVSRPDEGSRRPEATPVKASTLIQFLSKQMKKHGDLEVRVWDGRIFRSAVDGDFRYTYDQRSTDHMILVSSSFRLEDEE